MIASGRKATALITGASSGIGLELARIHAERGGDLVLVARRRERLHDIKRELESGHGITVSVIARDLSHPDAIDEIGNDAVAHGIVIDYLINNAGFGGYGLFHERDWDSDKTMIALNITALTALTRRFLPGMIERGRGRILNVSSMAGFVPGPYQAVYYATKAYVLSFSQAIAHEAAGTGVTVTALCPGSTATEFARAGNLEDVRAFRNTATARSVARAGYRAMLKGKPVVVPGLLNRLAIQLIRVLPRRVVISASRKTMEKR